MAKIKISLSNFRINLINEFYIYINIKLGLVKFIKKNNIFNIIDLIAFII